MPPPKGEPLTWLRPYNRFRENWQGHYGHTSFFGDNKTDFLRDWNAVKGGRDPRAATAIMKPKMEIVTEPMEIAEPTVSEKKTGLKIAPRKPKPKLSAENVGDFVKKLPREIEQEIASYIIEKDPLMEFDDVAGLVTLFYVLNLINQPNVPVGKIIYGLELTKSQNTNERINSWNKGKTFSVNPEAIINSMPAVQSALISIMSKSKDFSVEVYYGEGVGTKKSIRAKINWIGKKGERKKDSLWQDFWTQNIKPLIDNTARWNKAPERIAERRGQKQTSALIARDARKEKMILLGNALLPESSIISVNDTLKIVGQLLKKYKFQTGGYTKWKEKNSVGYIVEMMNQIFNEPKASADKLAVWNDFKKEIGI